MAPFAVPMKTVPIEEAVEYDVAVLAGACWLVSTCKRGNYRLTLFYEQRARFGAEDIILNDACLVVPPGTPVQVRLQAAAAPQDKPYQQDTSKDV